MLGNIMRVMAMIPSQLRSALRYILSCPEMNLITLRRTTDVVTLACIFRRRNDRRHSRKHTDETQSRPNARQETLNDLTHAIVSAPRWQPGKPRSDISTGSIRSSQASQCRSITSAIDKARLQPGQPQKKSKYNGLEPSLLPFLIETMRPLPKPLFTRRHSPQHVSLAAIFSAGILIDTNYVVISIDVNMIYVNYFASVWSCRNPWAND
jgi:hypothetical protein